MKIYVLLDKESKYSLERYIVGVFSSEEKLKKVIDTYKSVGDLHYPEVEEHDLDFFYEFADKKYRLYRVVMDKNGKTKLVKEERRLYPPLYFIDVYGDIANICLAKSKKHAAEITDSLRKELFVWGFREDLDSVEFVENECT